MALLALSLLALSASLALGQSEHGHGRDHDHGDHERTWTPAEIIQGLQSADEELQADAAVAFDDLEAEDYASILPGLTRLLEESPLLRAELKTGDTSLGGVIDRLGILGAAGQPVVPALLRLVREHPGTRLAGSAISSAGEIGAPSVVDLLLPALTYSDPERRRWAMENLKWLARRGSRG